MDTSFGRVGNDDFQILAFRIGKIFLKVRIRIHTIINDINHFMRLDGFAFFVDSLKNQGIKIILFLQIFDSSERKRLDNNDMSGIFSGIIPLLNQPINKGTKEVSFSELPDFDLSCLLRPDFLG